MELRKYEREKQTATETFNDGVAYIYKLHNAAEPGFKPVPELQFYKKLMFSFKTIGVRRNYEAMQAKVRLDEMIQVLLDRQISSQDVVVIEGVQYKIKQVQHQKNTYPKTSLLSLQRLEEDYDDLAIC